MTYRLVLIVLDISLIFVFSVNDIGFYLVGVQCLIK